MRYCLDRISFQIVAVYAQKTIVTPAYRINLDLRQKNLSLVSLRVNLTMIGGHGVPPAIRS